MDAEKSKGVAVVYNGRGKKRQSKLGKAGSRIPWARLISQCSQVFVSSLFFICLLAFNFVEYISRRVTYLFRLSFCYLCKYVFHSFDVTNGLLRVWLACWVSLCVLEKPRVVHIYFSGM